MRGDAQQARDAVERVGARRDDRRGSAAVARGGGRRRFELQQHALDCAVQPASCEVCKREGVAGLRLEAQVVRGRASQCGAREQRRGEGRARVLGRVADGGGGGGGRVASLLLPTPPSSQEGDARAHLPRVGAGHAREHCEVQCRGRGVYLAHHGGRHGGVGRQVVHVVRLGQQQGRGGAERAGRGACTQWRERREGQRG